MSKRLLAEKRAAFRLRALAGFREIPQVNIPEIPLERTLFPGTKNDYWHKIEVPDFVDSTYCLYELDKGCMFDPHYHEHNNEHCVFLTPNSKLEVITNKEEYFVSFPNGCFFKKGVPHALINKSDFKVVFLVIWTPKMKGWNAKFLSKIKEEFKQ